MKVASRIAQLQADHLSACHSDTTTSTWLHASTSGRDHTRLASKRLSTVTHRRQRYQRLVKSHSNKSSASQQTTDAFPLNSNGSNGGKLFDVVALSNLCVDVFVPVDELPSSDPTSRKELLTQLTAHPPPTDSWEVGGNTNFLIAASRLGLKTASIGHIGKDIYGQFLGNVLKVEGIELIEPVVEGSLPPELDATLLCFVLVDPDSRHAFCSRYDFGPWPLLSSSAGSSAGVQRLLENTAALFVNGFAFDDLPASAVLNAARIARESGAAVFFDPGPRAWTFQEGDRAAALSDMLDLSDVVLMTEEEAAAVTGLPDAESSAHWILDRPGAATEWCIVKRGAQGALLASIVEGQSDRHLHEQQALKIDVRDTVGCGDSFAAAVVLGNTRQHSVPVVMALANAVGAATAMGAGAGRNVAKAETVLELLQTETETCGDGRHKEAIKVLTAALRKAGRL